MAMVASPPATTVVWPRRRTRPGLRVAATMVASAIGMKHNPVIRALFPLRSLDPLGSG